MTQAQRKDLDTTTLELIDKTEANLLGSLLIAGSDGSRWAIEVVSKIITVDDFMPNSRNDFHKRVYKAMLESPRTDQISVANTMHKQGALEKNDISAMSYYISNAVTSIDCEIYAKQVRDLAQERRGRRLSKLTFKGGV